MSEEDLRLVERSQENLKWDEDIYKSIQGKKPDAKYGALSEFMRHAIKDTTQCALFCGGLKCKYDNPEHWKSEQMEINGLFSNWITDNIVAISRPSNKVIEEYDIIDQFKEAGIKSIINLQTPGEHASCGQPLDPSGFSYNPQTFMDNDIFFYNFGWPDYGVGSLSNILDMVKVTQFAVTEGKIAVHCHAGLGRTGVLIAAYLVYANRMDPHEVVHYIRSKRQGAIQTRNQVAIIEQFGAYLKPLRIVFSSIEKDTYDFTLPQYMIRQKHILHGLEAKNLKNIPKLIFVVCERLMELSLRKSHKKRYQRNSLKIMQETAPAAFNNRRSGVFGNGLKPSQSANLLAPHHSSSNGSIYASKSMENLSLTVNRLRASASSPRMLHRRLDRFSNSGTYSGDSDSGRSKDSMEFNGSSYDSRLGSSCEGTGLRSGPAENIALAMAQTEYSDEVYDKVEIWKKEVNEDLRSWQKLGEENDPLVLSKLMWDWLDHLKEPILTAQDLPLMLRYAETPLEGLQQLDKTARTTIEYMLGILTRLQPLSEETEVEVMQRILSTLTHQHMCAEYTVNSSIASNVSRRTLNSGEMSSNMVWRMLQFFVCYLTMSKEMQEENGQNDGDGDKPRSRNSTNFDNEHEERKSKNLRSSKDRQDPLIRETTDEQSRLKAEGSSGESGRLGSESKTRKKTGGKRRKNRDRSVSNERGERKAENTRMLTKYSDDDM